MQQLSGGWTGPAHSSKLDREISRAKRLVSKLESVRAERGDARQSMLVAHRSVRRRHDRGRGEPRAAIWAAMQSLMHSVDNTVAPHSNNLTPGSTWKFQCWFRDPPAGGATFNLSTGLSVTFQN